MASDTKGESGNLYTLGVFILLLQLQTETIHSWKLKVKATTVHGVLQARILEWVAFPFSRGSSQPRDRTQVSHIAGGFFTKLSHLGSPWQLKGNNRKSSHFDGNTQVLSQSWIQCNFRRKNIKNWWNQLLFQQKAAAKSTFNYNHPSLMFLKPLDTKLLQLFSP